MYGFPPSKDCFSTYPLSEMRGMIEGLAMYPVMYQIGGISSLIGGIDLMSACLWLPSLWSSTAILAIYIISKSLYSDKPTALLAALAFSAYTSYIVMHSQYFREGIAFTMILFTLYAFHAAYYKKKGRLRVLALLFAIAVTLSHYWGAIMLMAILIVWFSSLTAQELFAKKVKCLASVLPSKISASGFIIFTAVIILSHWVYMEISIIPNLVNLRAMRVIKYGTFTINSPAEYSTLLQQMTSFGTWFFTIIFGIILLLEVIKAIRGNCNYVNEDLSIGIWVTIGFILYSILTARPHMLAAARVPIFFYPFLLIIVSHAALTTNRHRIKQIIVVLIVLYIAFNLFLIPNISVNPLSAADETTFTSKEVLLRYNVPNIPPAIAASKFYQGTEDAKFTRWFALDDKKVMTEACENPWVRRPWYIRPCTRRYIIVSPDSYLDHDRIYNNRIVEIYKGGVNEEIG